MLAKAFTTVFRNKRYTLFSIVVALIVFVFATWLPNMRLLFSIITDSTIPLSDKTTFPLRLLLSITTNFTLLSASYTILTAILFGIDVAMLTFFLKRKVNEVRQNGLTTGFLGVVSGILGIGCAACGSFLLTSVLSFFGASGLLLLLPLQGQEFGILGVVLLSVSLYLTAKQIQNPALCKIN